MENRSAKSLAGSGIRPVLVLRWWGKGLFVAVGTNSAFELIHSSPNGVTSTNHTQTATRDGILHGVAFGDGRFVAVGTNTAFGVIASSTNGTTWMNHTTDANIGNWNAVGAAGIDANINAIACGSGVFVAVGQGGAFVWASLDGVHWEPAPVGFLPESIGGLRDVAYFQDHFYAVGFSGLILKLKIGVSGGPGPVVEPADVEIVRNGASFLLRWPSSTGLRYQVFGRSSPAAGAWMPAAGPMSGTGGVMQFNAAAPAGEDSWFWIIVTSL